MSSAFRPYLRSDLKDLSLVTLSRLDDAAFRTLFAGTPIKRTGRDRFLRNVLIAMGNSGQPEMSPEIERCLEDPSALVRGAAIWALAQLVSPELFNTKREAHLPREPDQDTRAEWLAGRDAA
jgi:epoxyqueuosine reductase